MNKWERFKFGVYLYLRYDIWEDIRNIRRRIWNKRIKLWWYRLFVRKDEFHSSLSTDFEVMQVMNEDELSRYYSDLNRRREAAHKRSLVKETKGE